MKQTSQRIKEIYTNHIPIICDNTSDINISNNHALHSKTKHINIKYPFIIEHVANQIVKLECIPTKERVFGIFTKPLKREPFEYLRQRLGFISLSLSIRYFPQVKKVSIQLRTGIAESQRSDEGEIIGPQEQNNHRGSL